MTEDARVRMPDTQPAAVTDRPRKRPPEPEWFPMEGAPQDGKPLLLKSDDPDPTVVEALWRHTRAINRKTGRWEPVGFWAIRNAGGQKVPFEPAAWRATQ